MDGRILVEIRTKNYGSASRRLQNLRVLRIRNTAESRHILTQPCNKRETKENYEDGFNTDWGNYAFLYIHLAEVACLSPGVFTDLG